MRQPIDRLILLEPFNYHVHKEALVIDLVPIHAFCFHERVHSIESAVLILPDGSHVQLSDEAEVKEYGVEVKQGNMTSTLQVYLDDASKYDHSVELTVRSSVREELTWFNTTQIKVNLLEPPCEVSVEEINESAADEYFIRLSATRGTT